MTIAAAHDPVLAAAKAGLVYLPLGGAGEIGMNLYLYGCEGKWIAVECGVTFGDETTPGVDVMMADPAFLETVRDDLLGIVLTHAHEDHQGAVAYLWPRLQCPVYATAFTAGLVRVRLAEAGIEREVPLHELPLEGDVALGPFRLRLVTVTHSIPEPNALAIETPFGRLVHTGDWKIDPDPLIGDRMDEVTFRRLGEAGVLAMVCDSTNVFVEGASGSEAEVREHLAEVVGRFQNRVAVACFASNIARIESIARAGAANGRHVALVGRSLWRLTEIARECGYLRGVPDFLTEHDAAFLPRERALLICTGSQGERGSALERISQGDHPSVVLEEGDAVLFSSRNIPGNERAIYALQDRLARRGVAILTGRDAPIHVSGHPARAELARLYEWVRPAILVPMHGTSRHLIEQAAYARGLGIREARVVTNGEALRLAPGPVEIVGRVPAGRLGLDGNRLVPMDDSLMAQRLRGAFAGHAFVTVVVDRKGRLAADPEVSLHGVAASAEEQAAAVAAVAEEVEQVFARGRGRRGRARPDDGAAEEVRRAVRRVLRGMTGKRPVTEVHVIGL
ncbi:MAG TPA: ribonuclease J [Alphaproteobacteria bacterium]|jgi:ribonuclease J